MVPSTAHNVTQCFPADPPFCRVTRRARVTDSGLVVFKALEIAVDWKACLGRDGYPINGPVAYAIDGPPRALADIHGVAGPPIVSVLGLWRHDEVDTSLVVEAVHIPDAQCLTSSQALINALAGPTVRRISEMQYLWRMKRPIWARMRRIHERVKPHFDRLMFNFSHAEDPTDRGRYTRRAIKAIQEGTPLKDVSETMSKYVDSFLPPELLKQRRSPQAAKEAEVAAGSRSSTE